MFQMPKLNPRNPDPWARNPSTATQIGIRAYGQHKLKNQYARLGAQSYLFYLIVAYSQDNILGSAEILAK
jgi:hypothetical protein